MKKYYGFIYVTTNKINNKKYLGMCSYHKRNHKTYLGSGKLLKQAIKKYGFQNFQREIIFEAITKEELVNAEISFIELLNCTSDPRWYNIMPGGYSTRGFTGKSHSEETKLKMKLNHNRPIYDSTREVLRENGKRNVHKAHEAHMKSLKENGHPSCQKTEFNGVMYNSKKEADIAKREFKKANNVGRIRKQVILNGVTYQSITHASVATGISRNTIKNHLLGKVQNQTLDIKYSIME